MFLRTIYNELVNTAHITSLQAPELIVEDPAALGLGRTYGLNFVATMVDGSFILLWTDDFATKEAAIVECSLIYHRLHSALNGDAESWHKFATRHNGDPVTPIIKRRECITGDI